MSIIFACKTPKRRPNLFPAHTSSHILISFGKNNPKALYIANMLYVFNPMKNVDGVTIELIKSTTTKTKGQSKLPAY